MRLPGLSNSALPVALIPQRIIEALNCPTKIPSLRRINIHRAFEAANFPPPRAPPPPTREAASDYENSPTMPPKEMPPHIIERTPEYEEFIEKLRKFHAERGTSFDPEPKVGTTHLDLLRVFKHIVKNGGYDKVSDEKLAWRRMASELYLYTNNEAATAFGLKEKFYKNLAAYEIKTIHGKEPPPKEILEDVTAKGSGLLKRTRENFLKATRNVSDSGVSGDDATPTRERSVVDTPGSSARASRGLREAPPQRVIFQPDTGPSRQIRHAPSQPSTPQHGTPQHPQAQGHLNQTPSHHPQSRGAPSGAYNPNHGTVSSVITSYNPRTLTSIPLRPVDTPGNNAVAFSRAKIIHKIRQIQAGRLPRVPPGCEFTMHPSRVPARRVSPNGQ